MTEVGFYHLQKWPLDEALPRLLEKVLAAGHRALVVAGSAERVAWLDNLLWTYREDSWLPHGRAEDPYPDRQPVLLSTSDDNGNQADVLVLTDGAFSDCIDAFARCCDMFDGHADEALRAARARWKACRDQGFSLSYYQQTDRGGWTRKA